MDRSLNDLLLDLLARYKASLVRQLAYQTELSELKSQFPEPARQVLFDRMAYLIAPLFCEAEQALRRGEQPQHTLKDLLKVLGDVQFE